MEISFAHLGNVEWLDALYGIYTKNPAGIPEVWRAFFDGMEFASLEEKKAIFEKAERDIRIYRLIEAYRYHGHLMADINPIATSPKPLPKELSLKILGFKEEELQELFPTCGLLEQNEATLQEILLVLQQIYCGKIGVEYMGYQSPELEKWLQEKIEPSRFKPPFSIEKKKFILQQLNRAELFETFLHTKYVGQKRFSLEGGETLIPILAEIIERGGKEGANEFLIGMSHRGRLNVLANIMNKSFSMIFSEFEDFYDPKSSEGGGDVKYHKGFSSDITTQSGEKIHISLTPNPSHLESVVPVVLGKTKAKQIQAKDKQQKKILPLLIHGDAALAGQGVIYESMQFYRLKGYSIGGALHLVINNQIGFTTLPEDARSTHYCTDLAKAFAAPVFHVNAEDPEGCVWAAQLALELRQKFGCDVFIDMNCYRKYGHNESDEPLFTQPQEYKLIGSKPSIREIYCDQLIQEGVTEKKLAEKAEEEFNAALHQALEEFKVKKEKIPDEAFGGVWKNYKREEDPFASVATAIDEKVLLETARQFCRVPPEFTVNPKVQKLLSERMKMAEGKEAIDWSMAEQFAFASLLWEGSPVRLTGQDTRRGTFSQRHAMLVDQKNSEKYYPLRHLKKEQGEFDVYDSPLSEFGALGFEFGYSLAYPSALVLWEAQFGDFVNGAQIIIDQYLSTSEKKWLRFSGLVLLLPHGYEGQGPEHSSGRMERFLQLAAEANVQIAYPTTPAQYFHLLRRQVKRSTRKPLIIFTPKGLLRHPQCKSDLTAFTSGTFEEILDDSFSSKEVQRLLLCTGRVYYDLLAEREKRKQAGIALLRIEQLYPLNQQKLKTVISQYHAKEIIWVQEEPSNMGAWEYIRPLVEEILPIGISLQYAGRNRSASPATGSHLLHQKEQEKMLDLAFGGAAQQ